VPNLDDLSGRTLGEFVLGECIDEGGFGAVYRCDQPMLGRKVVVKVLHQELRRDDAAIERFKREAKLASLLDHPNAAHVYAFGIEDDGVLWIAMELVDGVTLNHWLAKHGPMRLDQFVSFFEKVAQVVQAAHDLGIIHRDLKPSNIMVIERSDELWPKLLDFGVAKPPETWRHAGHPPLTDASTTPSERPPADSSTTLSKRPPAAATNPRCSDMTMAGVMLGSPQYMSPEQWTDPRTVGPAADVYALGIVAYEALTGRRPFDTKEFDGDEAVNKLLTLHRTAPIPPVGADFPLELDTIFNRALAKHPRDRFASVSEFAGALKNVIQARTRARVRAAAQLWFDRKRSPELLWRGSSLAELEQWRQGPSSSGRMGQLELEFANASRHAAAAEVEARRRRKTRIRLATGALLAAVAAAGLGAFQLHQVTKARDAKDAAERLTAATALTSEVEQGRAAVLHGEMAEARRHLGEACRRGDRSPATSFMLARAQQPLRAERARLAATSGRMWSAAWSPDGSRIVTTDDQAAQIWDASGCERLATLPHGATVHHVVWTAGHLVTASADGSVRIWTSDGQLERELRLPGHSPRWYVAAVAPDSARVAAVDVPGAIAAIWDARTGALVGKFELEGPGWTTLGFSSDGRWLAMSGGDHVSIVDADHLRIVATIQGPQIHAAAWDPAGPRLLTGSAVGDASLWAIPSGARVRHFREVGEPIDAVAWSPDRTVVALGARDGAEQVFDVNTGRLINQGNQLHSKVTAIAFDTASQVLAAGGASGAMVITDARNGALVTDLDGGRGVIRSLQFAPSQPWLLGASTEGTARIWDATSPYRRWSSPPIADGCDVVTTLEPDSRFVAVPCPGHVTQVWDTTADRLLAEVPSAMAPGTGLEPPLPALSALGDQVAVSRDHSVEVYEVPGNQLVEVIQHSSLISAVAFSRTGHDVVIGAVDGTVLVPRSGRAASLLAASRSIDSVGFLSNGHVAATDARGRLYVIDPVSGATIADIDVGTRIGLLRPSPDGNRLVVIPIATSVGPPILLDPEQNQVVARLDGHVGRVFNARWVSGDRFLTTGDDGSVRMWDSNGHLLQTYRGSSRLYDAVLDPSGVFVVSGGSDGILRYWDIATGRALWTTLAHKSAIVGLHFDGKALITRGFGGDLSRWRIDASCSGCSIVPTP
jgi:serine/threonine protein kinase/WD40 repeat protein